MNGSSPPQCVSSATPSLVRAISRDGTVAIAAPVIQQLDAVDERGTTPTHTVQLSEVRKWFLLFVLSLAQYLDIASFAGIFIYTERMQQDLSIPYATSSWILTAYSVTFGSFLLLWGRISDLYSAKTVFAFGFLTMAISNLIISFMPEQYSYYVFRAISGIGASATIPSAYRLLVHIFPTSQLDFALMLFSLSGALALVSGYLISGVVSLITADGQNSAWRWFFRVITIIGLPFAITGSLCLPKVPGSDSDKYTERQKLKRLDLPGCFIMFSAIVLLTLGLTLGASYGFKKAGFIVPFLLSSALFAVFLIYESRLPEGYASVPPATWRIPNLIPLLIFAVNAYGFWASSQLPLVQRWRLRFEEIPIVTAMRIVPQGASAFLAAFIVPPAITRLGSAKWPMVGGMVLPPAAFLLMILSGGDSEHNAYWRWFFPAFIFGSAAAMMVYIGVNISVITVTPVEMSGVSGALLQVFMQIGVALCLLLLVPIWLALLDALLLVVFYHVKRQKTADPESGDEAKTCPEAAR